MKTFDQSKSPARRIDTSFDAYNSNGKGIQPYFKKKYPGRNKATKLVALSFDKAREEPSLESIALGKYKPSGYVSMFRSNREAASSIDRAKSGSIKASEKEAWTTSGADDFKRLKLLGEGAYGAVYLASHLKTGKLVAIKYKLDYQVSHPTECSLV